MIFYWIIFHLLGMGKGLYNFSCRFLNPNNFFQFWDLRNLQEQVKKAFCYQKLFWPFTVWINCSSDLKNFENSRLSASNFKSFSRSLEQFFLTVGQNNFGNKISKNDAHNCCKTLFWLPRLKILELFNLNSQQNFYNPCHFSLQTHTVYYVVQT